MNNQEQPEANIPSLLPVLPLRDSVIYPFAVLPIVVGQERSIRLVDDSMRSRRLIVLVAQRSRNVEQAGPDDIYRIGTVATIHHLVRAPDGTLRIVVQGVQRVRILDFISTQPYLVARIEPAPDQTENNVEEEALRRVAVDLFRRMVEISPDLPNEILPTLDSIQDPVQTFYFIAGAIQLDVDTRQELLELEPLEVKLRRLVEILQKELSIREISQRIQSETQERLTQAQREAYLREQLRTIQSQLGEGPEQSEVNELRRRIEEAGLPEEARKEAERELNRLSTIPMASPEYAIIRTYLEWLADLPWNKLSGGTIDTQRAREILDEDHYDLEKVKDRIIEHLAVRKLREQRVSNLPGQEGTGEQNTIPSGSGDTLREPILCFVGPPGVGKTSLGQSIARALGRKFIRMSLGGIRDEAEIRGHRRTYIGAMPGRIIQGMRRVGTKDPVFMLDEIDKITVGFQGDPAAALLEVLDPAQNHSFVDNYLGVPFDLSQVLFIATANTLDTIPAPLLDRMEVIQISGYTEQEKLFIAQRYLIPKQMRAHGIQDSELRFTEESIRKIIREYTQEAGVRNLDRQIATICRKVARAIADGAAQSIEITPDNLQEYLGHPRHFHSTAERITRPGVATGLAWTPTGGEILFIEATMMPDPHPRVILTGMLGEVMRESAQIALSYVRSEADPLGVNPDAFTGKTVHIHVPAGAIPKDGPSAGLAIVAALASLGSSRLVRSDVAMTGEITLRGKVLPVGGIKEKVLAAHRAGIKTVILPKENEQDLEDIPQELRDQMRFVLVDNIEDAMQVALTELPVLEET